MIGNRTFRAAALMVASVIGLPPIALAESPWAKLMSTNRVEADPNKTYSLKEKNGPWTIMACSFSGEGAEKQAKELVLELRKRYRLDAYCHRVNFKLEDPNHSKSAQGEGPTHWAYQVFRDRPELSKESEIQETAVLVGNFPSVDDPEAQKMLKKIKSIEPDCLNADKGKATSLTFAGLRQMQQEFKKQFMPETDPAKQKKGPMGHAFISTNPLLPAEYYSPKGGVDEMVLRMNVGVTHSLLDCPGKYTIQVATFRGTVIYDQREIQKIQEGQESLDSSLTKAAEAAHVLTEALRIKGYESFEFHDRYASIVTVGSFGPEDVKDVNGKIQLNPKIVTIMKTFGGPPDTKNTPVKGQISVKSLAGIPFDYQSIPVEVPKRSISRELARRIDSSAE